MAAKIVLQLSKNDWRKAKNYKRARYLRNTPHFIADLCPINQCLRRNGLQAIVGLNSVYIGDNIYKLSVRGQTAVFNFDNKMEPLYGTIVLKKV